ncbi:uncharacterized protein LOC143919055 [Arctopsyche grandis]|uniref:uncharacterized protein LOC143919055 n=1 Tax=Arctopsyche grandis TaxID=121162 RepID=UPI00406D8BBE
MKAIIFLCFLAISAFAENQYDQIAKTGSGLYFDPLGQIKVSTHPLDVVTFINITSANTKLEHLKKIIKDAKVQSLKIEIYDKGSSFTASRESLDSLMTSCDSDLNSLSLSISQNRRTKRANIFGNIWNAISGDTSEKDIEKLQDAVSSLNSNLNVLSISFQNEVIGIKSSMNDIKEDVQEIQTNQIIVHANMRNMLDVIMEEKKLSHQDRLKIQEHEQRLDKTDTKLEEVSVILNDYKDILTRHGLNLNLHQKSIDILDIRTKMTTYMSSIQNSLRSISTAFKDLLTAISLAKKDVLHTAVISHQRIYDELVKNIHNVNQNSELPYPLTINHIQSLLDISSVISFVRDGIVIFALRIPLVLKYEFTLYQYFPMPIAQDPSKPDMFLFIQPDQKHSYLAISTFDKLSYALFKSIDNCKKLSNARYLCRSDRIVSTVKYPICETKLLSEHTPTMPAECDVRAVHGNINIWHKISNDRWIYVQTAINRLTMNCHDKDSAQEETVIGSGIMTIPDGCSANVDSFHLTSSKIDDITIPLPKVYLNIWNDSCCTSDILSEIKNAGEPATLISSDLNDLKDVSFKVKRSGLSSTLVYVCSAIGLVLIIVILVIVIFVIYKYRMACYRFLNCSKTFKSDQFEDGNDPTSAAPLNPSNNKRNSFRKFFETTSGQKCHKEETNDLKTLEETEEKEGYRKDRKIQCQQQRRVFDNEVVQMSGQASSRSSFMDKFPSIMFPNRRNSDRRVQIKGKDANSDKFPSIMFPNNMNSDQQVQINGKDNSDDFFKM